MFSPLKLLVSPYIRGDPTEITRSRQTLETVLGVDRNKAQKLGGELLRIRAGLKANVRLSIKVGKSRLL